jgi:cyclopropane-fatty-acyl-phospholipid synthase
MTKFLLAIAEQGFIPDVFIRTAVRFITKKRLNELGIYENKINVIKSISKGGIAEKTDDANEQHYEVPPGFFKYALGKNLKYSCSLFDNTDSLDEAEKSMIDLYIQRADIQEGQAILDLGCGWGSFSLYVAEKYPSASITAVSNSKDQITFIQNEAKRRGLFNVKASKMDVNNLDLDKKFDRIVSIEMFEHLRNYKLILKTLNNLLKPDGRLFVHIFCHKELTYFYEIKNSYDWMTKYFFEGGIMPSQDIFKYFDGELEVINQWDVNGNHYAQTCKAWLDNHYKNKDKILDVFDKHYDKPKIWFNRWRIFFLSCEAFFAINNGREYFVSHYLFKKPNK